MARSAKPLFVALTVAAALLATGPRAGAQLPFLRPAIPAVPFGFNIQPFYAQRQTLGFSAASPFGSWAFRVDRNTLSSFRPGMAYSSDPKMISGAMYGAAGGMGGGRDLVQEKQIQNIRRAQRAAAVSGDLATRREGFDRRPAERGGKRAGEDRLKGQTDAVRKAADPPAEAIRSGQALNEILKAVQAIEATGAKATSPYLPPELFERVSFAGGPAADALNMIRAGRVPFPASFDGRELAPGRDAVSRTFTAVADAYKAGKKLEPAAVDQFAADVERVRAQLPPAGPNRDEAAAQFVAMLEAVAKYLKEPAAAGLVSGNWFSHGVTIAELSRHMKGYDLKFAPAADGAAGAYTALHRGFVTYLTDLASVGK